MRWRCTRDHYLTSWQSHATGPVNDSGCRLTAVAHQRVHCHWLTTLHCVLAVTRRLHCTDGCTTGWVNYGNETSKALDRSSRDSYNVIRLTRCGAFDRIYKKNFYLFILFTVGSTWSRGMTKLDRFQKLYKTLSTLLYSIYFFIYYMNIQNVSCSWLCNRLHNRLYNRLNRLQSVNGLLVRWWHSNSQYKNSTWRWVFPCFTFTTNS